MSAKQTGEGGVRDIPDVRPDSLCKIVAHRSRILDSLIADTEKDRKGHLAKPFGCHGEGSQAFGQPELLKDVHQDIVVDKVESELDSISVVYNYCGITCIRICS